MLLRNHLLLLIVTLTLFACKKKIRNNNTDEINFSFHKRNFGKSADELLRDDKFTSLKVEIQYMDGFKPDANAVLNLKAFLLQHINKPKGIYFLAKKIKPVTDTILTTNQVDKISRANRTIYTNNKQIAVYILYTNGQFENNKILGQAFRNTSIVIYGKSVKENTSTFGNPTQQPSKLNFYYMKWASFRSCKQRFSNDYTT